MKRAREVPCPVCHHWHKWEQGETCAVCGHVPTAEQQAIPKQSAFPTEVLADFLYLGSYDNAARNELLKAVGIRHIVNTVAGCSNLHRNSFTYHTVMDEGKTVPLEPCLQFIEAVREKGEKVMVHCMSGVSRSPSVVIAYLMKCNQWSLMQSLRYLQQRRPCVKLTPPVQEQLLEFERQVFGRNFTDITSLSGCCSGTASVHLSST